MSAQFQGYSIRNIYPNWGAVDQKEETIPEVAEQTAYAGVETPVATPVTKSSKMNMGILLLVLVAIVLLFGKG